MSMTLYVYNPGEAEIRTYCGGWGFEIRLTDDVKLHSIDFSMEYMHVRSLIDLWDHGVKGAHELPKSNYCYDIFVIIGEPVTLKKPQAGIGIVFPGMSFKQVIRELIHGGKRT